MIYRGVVVGEECRVFAFPIDQRALRNARRVWRWMRICVATESSMAANPGRTSRNNRRRMHLRQTRMCRLQIRRRRNRVAQLRGRSRGYVVSRVASRRVVIMKDVVRVDQSDRAAVTEPRTAVEIQVNRRLSHAMSNRRRQLPNRRARIVVGVTVTEKHR